VALNRDFGAMLDDLRSALQRLDRPKERARPEPAQGRHRDDAAKA
jgi:hypothetical protein